MLYLLMLFRRFPRPVQIIVLAILLIAGISTLVRVLHAVHGIQERNQHVHTHSTAH